jgi:hypothetical protein
MDYSPTVRARRSIREIVRLRNDSGLSMDTAASRLDWSNLYGPARDAVRPLRVAAARQAGSAMGPGYVSGPIGNGRISTSNSGESAQLGRSSATLRHPHFRYAR